MARLNLKAIEERIKPLAGQDDYDREFIFALLLAYGRSKGNITRLRNGSLNIAKDPEHEVAQKNIIYFRETTGDLLENLNSCAIPQNRETPLELGRWIRLDINPDLFGCILQVLAPTRAAVTS